MTTLYVITMFSYSGRMERWLVTATHHLFGDDAGGGGRRQRLHFFRCESAQRFYRAELDVDLVIPLVNDTYSLEGENGENLADLTKLHRGGWQIHH